MVKQTFVPRNVPCWTDRNFCGENFRTTTVPGSEDFCQLASSFSRTSTNHIF